MLHYTRIVDIERDADAAAKRWMISIHPPRAGWDVPEINNWVDAKVFQSTHPVRGGTGKPERRVGQLLYFNPPTPCGVGLDLRRPLRRVAEISIHPPRAGWDWPHNALQARGISFQSTHPVRGGTQRE